LDRRSFSLLFPVLKPPPTELMSKLWIVHRSPQSQLALARIAGRDASEVVCGAPNDADFAEQTRPDAVVLSVVDDFERELEFAHRMRPRLGDRPFILLAAPEDASEAARLFGIAESEILDPTPSPRALRARIAAAFVRKRAESLAARRTRQRIADRFSSWLGGIEIPGLLRALDPSLAHLPFLVRGVPGSGRTLLARYVEIFRRSRDGAPSSGESTLAAGPSTIRIHAGEIEDVDALARRIATRAAQSPSTPTTVWIDEVDLLPVPMQRALAEWIQHDAIPGALALESLHWTATAGPFEWRERLEPALLRAFAPLIVEIPALGSDADAIVVFAREIAQAWSRSVGGPARTLSTEALAELSRSAWPGDRAEVESVLRATLAATGHDPIAVEDLVFDGVRLDASDSRGGFRDDAARGAGEGVDEASGRETLPVVEAVAEGDAGEDEDADLLPLEVLEADLETLDEPPPWFSEAETESDSTAVFEDLSAFADAPGDSASIDESALLADASFGLAETDEEIASQAERAAEEAGDSDATWRKLARSLSHEIRNPLVSIKTFAELLPEHYADETFRARFSDLVGRDIAHITDVVSRMQDVAERDAADLEATDVSAILEELREERRERIAARRLLVLRELERDAPLAWAEPESLRIALAGLIDRALDSLPERGDLFVATRHVERGQDGTPRLRILLRHHNPGAPADASGALDELRPESNELEYVLAETVARASGGSLTLDTSDAEESLILLELRTPN
jgi:DNA-binding NtrC family response regulator